MAARLIVGADGYRCGRRLLSGLESGRPFRLGEAAVVSTKVHVLQTGQPGIVTVLADADAGQVFYHRERPGDVCHLDLFHRPAEVDHRAVAGALRVLVGDAVAAGRLGPGFADYIDIQTGTGGGRITGALTFGRRPAVRAAHLHHIHLTVPRHGLCPALLPEIVDCLEQLLLGRGVPLRRVERLEVSRGGSGHLDLSDYSDRTDSLLRRQRPHAPSPAANTGPGAGARTGRAAERGPRAGADAGIGAGAGDGAGAGAGAGPHSGAPHDGWDWRSLAELGDAAGGLEELRRALQAIRDGLGRSQFGASHSLPLLRQLEATGLARDQRGQLTLSPAGMRLQRLLTEQLFELEHGLRRSYRLVQTTAAGPDAHATAWGPRGRAGAAGRARDVRPVPAGALPLSLDPAATVGAALRRRASLPTSTVPSGDSSAGAGRPRGSLTIVRSDWRESLQRRRVPPSVFLLIDCSASMAGRRLQAAKFLARYLLVAARARVAVMAFQADQAELVVPFTRRYSEADRGLRRLAPAGLTPLARGLVEATSLLQAEKSRRPLLLLITDGIPTVPLTSDNPVSDALNAAALVAEQRLTFGCIGLEPSRSYLTAIAEQGKGCLYILEDLEEAGLVTAANEQLARHYARGHGRRRNG